MTIRENIALGVENFGSVFPALGKVAGAGLVLKSTCKLNKSFKKLKFKGVKQL